MNASKKREEKPSLYTPGFRLLRGTVRLFAKRWRLTGAPLPEGPCLFVSRHLNNYGPVQMFLQMPVEFRLWVFATLMDREKSYPHLRNYTFHTRLGFPLWLSGILAGLCSKPMIWLTNSIGAIPVHRGSRELMQTILATQETLEKGENVMVFTDREYTATGGDVGELYAGFVYIARLYNRKTGKNLSIVPVVADRQKECLCFYEPLRYDAQAGYSAEKERLIRCLHEALSLPEEKPLPRENQANAEESRTTE